MHLSLAGFRMFITRSIQSKIQNWLQVNKKNFENDFGWVSCSRPETVENRKFYQNFVDFFGRGPTTSHSWLPILCTMLFEFLLRLLLWSLLSFFLFFFFLFFFDTHSHARTHWCAHVTWCVEIVTVPRVAF